MRVVCTIEARMGSTRLPGKMMKELVDGRTTLECVVTRLQRCAYADAVVVATSTKDADDVIAEAAADLGVGCFRGSEEDVLDRIVNCAREFDADVICETNGDCPLIDPEIVDQAIVCYVDNQPADYLSNVLAQRWPHGMAVEVVSRETLEHIDEVTTDEHYREHVTTYVRDHPEEFETLQLSPPPSGHAPQLRVTLDYPEDLELIRAVYERLVDRGDPFEATAEDVIAVFDEEPHLREINAEHVAFDPDTVSSIYDT